MDNNTAAPVALAIVTTQQYPDLGRKFLEEFLTALSRRQRIAPDVELALKGFDDTLRAELKITEHSILIEMPTVIAQQPPESKLPMLAGFDHWPREAKFFMTMIPGALEMPLATKLILDNLKPQAVMTMGIIIRGETQHNEVVAKTAAQSLDNLALDHKTPIIQGIISANDRKGVEKRIESRSEYFAAAILNMLCLKRSIEQTQPQDKP